MNTSNSSIRVLLVGGGSGGHFYPLIAMAEALQALPERPALYYAGPEPYDAEALRALGIAFVRIPAGKRRRNRFTFLLNALDSVRTFFGFFVALLKLYLVYPDVVVSKGGYTSVPVVLAAAFLRIPIVVHESDSVMGRANKLGSRLARHTLVAYQELAERVKRPSVLLFGIPVRKVLLAPATGREAESLNIPPGRPVIFVIGGSQGAVRVNELILDSLDELLGSYTVIHQTGKGNFELVKLSAENLITKEEEKQYYLPAPFLDAGTLHDVYNASSLVISRAGSTSIYEIALHGKPSILIPISEEVSHDQRSNAYAYARTGAATVLEEKNLTDTLLRAEIDRIMQNVHVSEQMAQAAASFPIRESAEKIAHLVVQVAREH